MTASYFLYKMLLVLVINTLSQTLRRLPLMRWHLNSKINLLFNLYNLLLLVKLYKMKKLRLYM